MTSENTTNVSREELARMLSELSDDALQYVQRPILYAYYHADDRPHNPLSVDDLDRLALIGAATHDSPELVRFAAQLLRAARDSQFRSRRR